MADEILVACAVIGWALVLIELAIITGTLSHIRIVEADCRHLRNLLKIARLTSDMRDRLDSIEGRQSTEGGEA